MKNNIRTLRKRCGMTQVELAKIVNVNQSAVSLWERGCTKPVRKYMKPLADALGVDVEELALEEKPRHRTGTDCHRPFGSSQ